MSATLHAGNSKVVLAAMPANSVDAIVTDPPYELGFMGKAWDASGIAYDVELWEQCLRVLKPGGHLLAFGGTRTYHRMAAAIEDAGFEIRDSIHWIYGSGFPKSLDVSKAIDKAAEAEREVIAERKKLQSYGSTAEGSVNEVFGSGPDKGGVQQITAPATPDAQQWQGWGTALKPAHEPIVVARKPFKGTVAANVLEHGTGALHIDACRVGYPEGDPTLAWGEKYGGGKQNAQGENYATGMVDQFVGIGQVTGTVNTGGRWPANIVLTHDEHCGDACAEGCPCAEMDAQSGNRPGASSNSSPATTVGFTRGAGGIELRPGYNDSGGASRFFPAFRYQAKAPASERPVGPDGTKHATVKPLALMRWLVRLVTPPGGKVLDPFAGSGTTIEAAILEGFEVVGIELDPAHVKLCRIRIVRARAADRQAA